MATASKKVAADAAAKKSYTALLSIRMGGKAYAPGDAIELDAATAARYLEQRYVCEIAKGEAAPASDAEA